MQAHSKIEAPQIALVSQAVSARLAYTATMLFKRFIGIRIEFFSISDWNSADWAGPALAYAPQPIAQIPTIFANGLLSETHIRNLKDSPQWHAPSADFWLENDVLAYFFYHLSHYSQYQLSNAFDEEGRHLDTKVGYYLHEALQQLETRILELIPSYRLTRVFDYEITIDVDQPWKYKHKPAIVQYGGLLKRIFQPRAFAENFMAIFKGEDPYDSALARVKEICPAEKTKIFFLLGGKHYKDSRFDLQIEAYSRLVLEWQQCGFEIGIHPSYESSRQTTLIRQEKSSLEQVVGSVNISRQHYLRYLNPSTFRALIDAGIEKDYSICPKTEIGLVSGISLPYLWYDLERNEPTKLEIVPCVAMDRSLISSLKLNPQQSTVTLQDTIQKLKEFKGRFVIILHNETFCESGEWRGWLQVVRETVNSLQT